MNRKTHGGALGTYAALTHFTHTSTAQIVVSIGCCAPADQAGRAAGRLLISQPTCIDLCLIFSPTSSSFLLILSHIITLLFLTGQVPLILTMAWLQYLLAVASIFPHGLGSPIGKVDTHLSTTEDDRDSNLVARA